MCWPASSTLNCLLTALVLPRLGGLEARLVPSACDLHSRVLARLRENDGELMHLKQGSRRGLAWHGFAWLHAAMQASQGPRARLVHRIPAAPWLSCRLQVIHSRQAFYCYPPLCQAYKFIPHSLQQCFAHVDPYRVYHAHSAVGSN